MTEQKTRLRATTGAAASDDHPNVLLLPPVVYVATLAVALLLHLLWPMRIPALLWPRTAGSVILVGGLTLGWWGFFAMRRAGTNVNPGKPALAIVTDGPFQFTRNPIYLANALVYLALMLLFRSTWPLVFFLPMLVFIQHGIILREERYLEAKFGEPYRLYKTRVPRWI